MMIRAVAAKVLVSALIGAASTVGAVAANQGGPRHEVVAPITAEPLFVPREPVPQGQFIWPLAPPVTVVRPFDLPAQPWLAGHRGVDLAGPAGAEVLVPADGTVSFNGWIVDRPVVVVRHGELASTLEPCVSDAAVGAVVGQGQVIGIVGEEGAHCPGCLHWGVRRGEIYLDPTLLLAPRPRAVLWR